jgi:hypothetical protein
MTRACAVSRRRDWSVYLPRSQAPSHGEFGQYLWHYFECGDGELPARRPCLSRVAACNREKYRVRFERKQVSWMNASEKA